LSGSEVTREELATKEAFLMPCHIPLSGSGGRGSSVDLPQNLPLFSRCWLAIWLECYLSAEAMDATKSDLAPLHLSRTARCASVGRTPAQYIEEAQLRQTDPQLRSFIHVNTLEEVQGIV
jgi:hypothetical protein